MTTKPKYLQKTPKLKKLLPERIARLLGDRPTAGFEEDEEFDWLHAEMIVLYEPKDFREHLDVWDIVCFQWQAIKLREMLSASVEVKLAAAAHTLLGYEYMCMTGLSWAIAQPRLTTMVRKAAYGDTSWLESLEHIAERAGVSLRMLKTEALSLALPTYSVLMDLILKAERRRDAAISRLENRRKSQAAMQGLLSVSRSAVDVEISDEEKGPIGRSDGNLNTSA